MFGCLATSTGAFTEDSAPPDVVIYCASPGGIMAAVAAAREGANVLVVEPTKYVGGIVAQGGLVLSDLGDESTIGGLARDFFGRVDRHYTENYGAKSPQREQTKFQGYPGGCFEPRVAEMIFEKYLGEYPNIQVLREAELAGGKRDGTRIMSIRVSLPDGSEKEISGKIFIDASYTGDLLAKAGVSYQVGREAGVESGESLARPAADRAIQAYNYRVTLTNNPENRVPITRPDNYDQQNYAYMLDGILANKPYRIGNLFRPYWRLPNQKQDTNVADMAGENYDYPEATPDRRREIEKAHRDYSLGFLYFLQNDERVPQEIRDGAREWGLPRDEFPDNGHFPRAIYVREARRMKGEYLMRQQDLQEERRKADGIALGSYAIDSHAVKTYRDEKGRLKREGYVFLPVKPYAIPYRAMLPKRGEADNLLVPVVMSSTHIAWASLRMEPVFMMTGEAAGAAAAQALAAGRPLHDIDTAKLREALAKNGALVDVPPEPTAAFTWEPAEPAVGQEVTFTYTAQAGASEPARYAWDFDGDGQTDSAEAAPTHKFTQAKRTLVSLAVADATGKKSSPVAQAINVGGVSTGDAQLDAEDEVVKTTDTLQSISQTPYWGTSFHHDGHARKGRASATFRFQVAKDGKYSVLISTTEPGGRSSNTPVTVAQGTMTEKRIVNQNNVTTPFGLAEVGDFDLKAGEDVVVTISNEGTDNYTIFDLVRIVLLP